MSEMHPPAAHVHPSNALYIKLGRAGIWEKECIDKGILRFGYKATPFEAARSGDWDAVHQCWLETRKDHGAATRDVRQIRAYFESDETVLWVTFHSGMLWWCFAKPGVKQHADGEGSYRETVDGWRNVDARGDKLTFETLSGGLLKMQAFRGTICDVKELDYLKRKLNGQLLPEVDEAVQAENQMVEKIVPLMRLLTWQDFELLVDLVFSNSGWRRVGQVGKTQKTVDIELMLPTTGERAFVQIKASTTKRDLADYQNRWEQLTEYDRMFFVWHSGDLSSDGNDDVSLIGPERLARMVFDAGLTSWLRAKVP